MTKAGIADLQKHLNSNPQIKKVFFNKKGEWLFHTKRGEFTTEVSRKDVLAEGFAPEGLEDETPVVVETPAVETVETPIVETVETPVTKSKKGKTDDII